jgi:glycolate oxidase
MTKNKQKRIYEKIVKIVGQENVSDDMFERQVYSHDLAPLPKHIALAFKIVPDIVVRPRSAEEVSKIVKLARKEDVPITPRGAGSWGIGGGVASQGGILLDMTSMNKIIEIDEENLYITVEAGITWKEVITKLARMEKDAGTTKHGLKIGSYPSSAPAATIGGWINTGGVGISSYKYGGAENQLRSLEVVLPNGNIINTGFPKVVANSSGYDLTRLFVGSEGTLGIITKATLKLYPKPEKFLALSYSLPDIEKGAKAIDMITKEDFTPLHMSYLDKNHNEYLRELGLSDHEIGALVNVALEGSSATVAEQEKIIDAIMMENGGEKLSEEIAMHEWDERFFELRVKRLGPSLILYEVFVPVSDLYEAIRRFNEFAADRKLPTGITGVISDRNTATLMPYFLVDERHLIKFMTSLSTTAALGNISFDLGGRPAGLGTFWASNLPRLHGKGSLVMDDIKSAIDPYGVLNPGKMLEGVTRFGIPIPGIGMKFGMSGMALFRRVASMAEKKPQVSDKSNDPGD